MVDAFDAFNGPQFTPARMGMVLQNHRLSNVTGSIYWYLNYLFFQRPATNLPKQSFSTNQTSCWYCSNKTRPTSPSAPGAYQTNLPVYKRPPSCLRLHDPEPSQQLHLAN